MVGESNTSLELAQKKQGITGFVKIDVSMFGTREALGDDYYIERAPSSEAVRQSSRRLGRVLVGRGIPKELSHSGIRVCIVR